ncbi:hypothetical protein NDU88_000628 [Pleurodeles waltl]|uniref:Uncharacterized protein n=1 Tax=Pleurodeles waltl TaxID=8319 RepID=A0AAV7MHD7_PLEWA|nr:hypothetical protein NDU88_000628 [Pleurodeles waltl]
MVSSGLWAVPQNLDLHQQLLKGDLGALTAVLWEASAKGSHVARSPGREKPHTRRAVEQCEGQPWIPDGSGLSLQEYLQNAADFQYFLARSNISCGLMDEGARVPMHIYSPQWPYQGNNNAIEETN